MKTNSYYFDLPQELVAQKPTEERGKSRLLVLNRKKQSMIHSSVMELIRHLDPKTTIIFNNTKVRRARLLGERKDTGGKVEVLLLNPLDPELKRWKVMISRAKRQRISTNYIFPANMEAKLIEINEDLRTLEFSHPISDQYLNNHGHIPLPPYIAREDEAFDQDRYQTVYADKMGSVAAPTAGLHFTDTILNELQKHGVNIEYITLHVGLGTFLPVRTDIITDHKMHSENYEISEEVAERLNIDKKEGRRILAVGTTVVRSLESAAFIDAKGYQIKSGEYSTDMFIYPGYKFKFVDQIFTNFHTPESTLLMLVSAFAGKDFLFKSYEEAIEKKYRFFSYGDAMLIK